MAVLALFAGTRRQDVDGRRPARLLRDGATLALLLLFALSPLALRFWLLLR